MNELQKALMRRRNLNGELGGKSTVTDPATSESGEVPRESPNANVRKEFPKPADTKSTSTSASELQAKLARRRGLNGEAIGNARGSDEPALQTSGETKPMEATPVHHTASTEDKRESESETISIVEDAATATPAWLSETVDTISSEKVECSAQSVAVPTTELQPEPENSAASHQEDAHVDAMTEAPSSQHDAEGTVEPTPQECAVVTEVESIPAEEVDATTGATSAQVVCPPTSQHGEEQTEKGSVIVKEEAEESAHRSAEEANHAAPAEPIEPMEPAAPVTSASDVDTTTATTTTMMTEVEESAVEAVRAPAHDTPAADAVPAVSVVLVEPLGPAVDPATIMLSTTTTAASEALSSASSAGGSQALPVQLSMRLPDEVAASSVAERVAAAEAPSLVPAPISVTTTGGTVPLVSPTCTETASPRPASQSPSPATRSGGRFFASTSPLHRTRTDTGAATPASKSSSSSALSPLRRTASLTAGGSQSVSAKRSSWYPGKFLMEGTAGWSSKNSTPRLRMNPDAARDHYAALMSSSAQEYPEEQLIAAAAEHRAASAAEVGGGSRSPIGSTSHKRAEDLRAAQLPDLAAAGSSDDTIDMVLQLSRENAALKREVVHLKAALAQAHATIQKLSTAHEGNDAVAVPHQDAKANSVDKAEEQQATNGAVGFTVEATRSHSGEKVLSGSSGGGGLVKSRSSRRYGARSFYSSYDSNKDGEGGGEEEDENLFGEIDTDEGGRSRPATLTSKFTIDELTAQMSDLPGLGSPGSGVGRGRGGSALQHRQSSFGSSYGGGNNDDEDDEAAGGSSSAQNLDLLLKSVNSVTGSGSKEKRGASQQHNNSHSGSSERYLVQSFMSTSTITSKETVQERGMAGGERGQGDLQDRLAGLISSTGAKTEDQLFDEEPDSKARAQAAAANPDNDTMDYTEFIGKFTRTIDLVNMTRDFIFSIVGPNGDTTPPVGRKKLNYIFYGTYKMEIRCKQFFDSVEDLLHTWPEFQNLSDERLMCARDGIEQYVMTRVGEWAFKSVLDTEGDELLQRRMKLLSFVKPEMLEIKPEMFNETLLAIAADELRKINKCRTPADKVACVTKSVTLTFRSLSLSKTVAQSDRQSSGGGGGGDEEANYSGADEFMPLYIWVVLRSNITMLSSTVAYILAYLNPARQKGRWGYCLINLSSAIEFVKHAEPDQFTIDPKEFEAKLMLAEKQLNGGF